jgi:hypothetical protein
MAPARDHFRAYPRRASAMSVALRVEGREERVRLVDIGLGGAGVVPLSPLPTDAHLFVVLHAPNRWDPLVLRARVSWVKEGRAGLAFEGHDDAEVYALYELLAAHVFDK